MGNSLFKIIHILFVASSVFLVFGSDAVAAAEQAASQTESSKSFWQWWIGAPALGLTTFGFWWLLRVPLGASASWDRLVGWRDELAREKMEDEMCRAPKEEVMNAVMSATMVEFGKDAVKQQESTVQTNGSQENQAVEFKVNTRVPWLSHIIFLTTIAVGAAISSLLNGGLDFRFDLGEEHGQFFGVGWQTWAVLFVGGILIGFGTRLGGGCTSGHGLSGLSGFQLGSLVGTMSFFGAAIIVSFILKAFI